MIQLGPEDKWADASSEGSVAAEQRKELLVSRAALQGLFAQLDTDANGRLDAPELLNLAHSLGRRWTDAQAVAVLRSIDADADGLVAFDELYEW